MLIQALTLNNFRVFKGEHTIQLSAGLNAPEKKNIILFGGLNGAGKTSILTAVRLALYGRNSAGTNTSKKKYTALLRSFIHQGSEIGSNANTASVRLEFSHDAHAYIVTRSWNISSDNINEKLSLERDGKILSELSREQCQAFLDQLIPIGVADLFFFDGEKISELAEEDGSDALARAIHQMLGLKFFEKLRSDLGQYLREELRNRDANEEKQSLRSMHQEFAERKQQYEIEKELLYQQEDTLSVINAEITQSERAINQQGGAWAETRSAAKQELKSLEAAHHKLSTEIRNTIDGKFPLVFAPTKLQELANILDRQKALKSERVTRKAVAETLRKIKARLREDNIAQENVISVISSFSPEEDETNIQIRHNVPDRVLYELQQFSQIEINESRKSLSKQLSELAKIERRQVLVNENLERAPEEGLLKRQFEKLSELAKRRASIEYDINVKQERLKSNLREIINFGKKVQMAENTVLEGQRSDVRLNLAAEVRSISKEFVKKSMANKAKSLETEFLNAFRRLSRKDDLLISVEIDPETFSVAIRDALGRTINKDQMSAGERQIYAISMLEALGILTGLKLPVIIDTPLGRLDSAHRQKLVENYFPNASHQVVILSTDTEIDESFSKSLAPFIAHSYKIEYQPDTNQSTIEDGYFWNGFEREAS